MSPYPHIRTSLASRTSDKYPEQSVRQAVEKSKKNPRGTLTRERERDQIGSRRELRGSTFRAEPVGLTRSSVGQ